MFSFKGDCTEQGNECQANEICLKFAGQIKNYYHCKSPQNHHKAAGIQLHFFYNFFY